MRKKARSLIFYKTSVVLDDNDFLPGLNCETVTSYTVFHYFSVNASTKKHWYGISRNKPRLTTYGGINPGQDICSKRWLVTNS